MPYPYCQSSRTREQIKKTGAGYRTFRCVACRRRFNERSGTPFNDLRVPTDVVVVTRQAAQQRSTSSSCQSNLTIP